MYKQVKGLFQKSQLTNLAASEKLFSDSNLWYYLFTGFVTAIIVNKVRKGLRKVSMEAHRR